MKLALYRANGSYELVGEVAAWRDEPSAGYIRLTEIVEVDFQRLSPEITVPAELAQLDTAEAELRNKFNEALSALNTRRANLQALTHVATA